MLEDFRDPLFKGCTRPAMMFGVPLVPLAVVSAGVILISVWTTILFALALFPIVGVMHLIAKSDDQQFRLLGLKIQFRIIEFDHNSRFWKASAYSPLSFRQRR
jgi:type IV secretory pathway VirB3-like protein